MYYSERVKAFNIAGRPTFFSSIIINSELQASLLLLTVSTDNNIV